MRLAWCLLAGLVGCGGSAFSVTSAGPDGSVAVDATADGTASPGDSSAPDASDASSTDAADASDAADAGDAEGGPPDGGVVRADAGVVCGPTLACTGTTDICCLAAEPACETAACGSCATQLACAADRDCSGLTAQCCIGNVKDATCTAGHYVSHCAAACGVDESRLCDPMNQSTVPCLGAQCSTATADLQAVGLPGPPYGVCK